MAPLYRSAMDVGVAVGRSTASSTSAIGPRPLTSVSSASGSASSRRNIADVSGKLTSRGMASNGVDIVVAWRYRTVPVGATPTSPRSRTDPSLSVGARLSQSATSYCRRGPTQAGRVTACNNGRSYSMRRLRWPPAAVSSTGGPSPGEQCWRRPWRRPGTRSRSTLPSRRRCRPRS